MIKLCGRFSILHSAKGSEWEKHKYIKKLNGDYYYPDSYEGGRHLDSSDGEEKDDKHLSDEDVEHLARETIRGSFGNGEVRKQLLGGNYQQIQNRVNELYGKQTISEVPNEVKTSGEAAIKKATKATMNMQIYSAYGKGNKK